MAGTVTSMGMATVDPSRGTSLLSSTMTTNWLAMLATSFSMVWAAPPPFVTLRSGSTSSAPSTAKSIARQS